MVSLDFLKIFFIAICLILNIAFIKRIKRNQDVKGIIFGFLVTIVGIIYFNFVWNKTFDSMEIAAFSYFIPIYLIVTGLVFAFIGCLFKNKNE